MSQLSQTIWLVLVVIFLVFIPSLQILCSCYNCSTSSHVVYVLPESLGLPNFHVVHILTECLSIFLILGHFECRCAPLSHTVDHSHSTAWSTCERLQMFAMLVLMPLKWPQLQSRPVAVAQVSGPPSLQVTVHRKIWRNRCTWKYKHPALMKRKWCQNIAVQPVYVSEFVILLHLIWNWCLSHLSLVNT